MQFEESATHTFGNLRRKSRMRVDELRIAGLAATFALARYLESIFYGVASRDAVVFIGVVLTVFAAAVAATERRS